MVLHHPPHNIQVLRTWECRPGHYISRDDRAAEGRSGVIVDGSFIPFQLEISPPLLPATTGGTFNAHGDPFCNSVKAFEENILAEKGRNDNVGLEDALDTSKSCQGATPNLHATVVDDDIYIGALLSYLPFPKRIIKFVEDTGLEASNGEDFRQGSVVIITHVSTIESAALEDILHRPLPDRIRIARRLFEESSKGTSHFSSAPGDGDDDVADRASAMGCAALASELNAIGGDARPSFPTARSELDGADDLKPIPSQAALAGNPVVLSTNTSKHAGRMMFIHYARAMERPSVWRGCLDWLSQAKNTMSHYAEVVGYWFRSAKRLLCGQGLMPPPYAMKADYFPLDELLKYMLAVTWADIAVASTLQLLKVFEDEDEMPVEAKDIRRALRRVKPAAIVEWRRDSTGRIRRVALLLRAPSDTASMISDVTLYQMDLASKSEKWDDWSDTSTEVDTASFISKK